MAKDAAVDEIPQDVPLFLRKTYHMISSCDEAVAGWSEDGETFVVKDPSKFEREIIPQFFKHNKFSSFVRQLNFYSFRKIKYVDTIRLDPKLEAATANFWRFRHDKFQKGKPHWLVDIKRMNGQNKSSSATTCSTATSSSAAATADTVGSSSTSSGKDHQQQQQQPDAMIKTELDTLKKRIEEMNKNMTELTTMVQKVTIDKSEQQQQQSSSTTTSTSSMEEDGNVPVGSKRKKLDASLESPEDVLSSTSALPSVSADSDIPPPPAEEEELDAASPPPLRPLPPQLVDNIDDDDADTLVRPDEMLSSVVGYEEILPMDLCENEPVSLQALGTTSTTKGSKESSPMISSKKFSTDDALIDLSQSSSNDAAEQEGDGDTTMQDASALDDVRSSNKAALGKQQPQSRPLAMRRRADPALMERLSEALAVLPRAMQEQIVERLIAAITTTDLFAHGKVPTNVVPNSSSSHKSVEDSLADDDESATSSSEIGMPLAAATLAALLSHYSEEIKKAKASASQKQSQQQQHHQQQQNCGQQQREQHQQQQRQQGKKSSTIPVIPVHA